MIITSIKPINKNMKKIILLSAAVVIQSAAFGQQSKSKVTDYVNPFIGTGAVESSLLGGTYPGATVPFGMVQLSPDTRENPDWAQAAGYDYNDKTIYGFSHTHLSGTGLSDLLDILLMPVTGDIKDIASKTLHQSPFSHEKESARPGYYQVMVDNGNINAELTTSTHVGFHRYTYPKGTPNILFFDLNHSREKNSWGTKIFNSNISVIDEYTIEGYRLISGWARFRKVYFHAKFSKPIARYVMYDEGRLWENTKIVNGQALTATLEFKDDGAPLLVKVGLSAVNGKNARMNLEQEVPHWDFDRVVADADAAWEKELSKIKIEASEIQKEIFYTALYHAFIQPNVISDVNGDYFAMDYTEKKLDRKDEVQYTTFSLWDTYRAAHPLYTIVQPERSTDFVNSLLRQYDSFGYLPIWQLWGQENYCMIGNHSIPVIVDAVMKGLPGIDINRAYEAIKESSLISHLNSPFEVWEKYGYMPEPIQTQSVSITLEMAYDDWCVAQLAKKLGKEEDYQRFIKRSQFYRNLFNEKTKFFQSKDEHGKWIEPFDPFKYGANGGNPFTEGNAWQYYWYVPQDVADLIKLTGGDKAFSDKLDQFFTLEHHGEGEINSNASGFIGQYAHGNEPSHHVAYLYNYVGQPWKTQYYVSKIMNEMYDNTSAGYAGNDDCGEMSAWYVFSAIGFYPVNPADGMYVIGSPLVEKAEIRVPGGKIFVISAPKRSADDIYIQSVKLNGKNYDKLYITHDDLLNGGTMEFKMTSKPDKKYGVAPKSRP